MQSCISVFAKMYLITIKYVALTLHMLGTFETLYKRKRELSNI
jgi:hypothetical protein